jgi:hypothetical protein
MVAGPAEECKAPPDTRCFNLDRNRVQVILDLRCKCRYIMAF